jgi:hypothetical protein
MPRISIAWTQRIPGTKTGGNFDKTMHPYSLKLFLRKVGRWETENKSPGMPVKSNENPIS